MSSKQPSIAVEVAPRLVVSDGDAALGFYGRAFGAPATDQHYEDGRLVNAHVQVGESVLGIAEEDGVHNFSPSTIGGTGVLLGVTVPDADAAAQAFLGAGGEVVIELGDRPYGRRDGRFRDPFDHLWIIGQPL